MRTRRRCCGGPGRKGRRAGWCPPTSETVFPSRQKAISCAPRGQRFQWLLKIQVGTLRLALTSAAACPAWSKVGTHSISPLYWAIESGSLAAAEATQPKWVLPGLAASASCQLGSAGYHRRPPTDSCRPREVLLWTLVEHMPAPSWRETCRMEKLYWLRK